MKRPSTGVLSGGTLTLWISLGLLIGIVLFFYFLPVLPFVSYQSPLHDTHPFTLVWSNQQRKIAIAIFCVAPQSYNQPDFTALNHDCSESRKSQKSFMLHIASYLVAREGSTDWRQLFLLVGLEFTD